MERLASLSLSPTPSSSSTTSSSSTSPGRVELLKEISEEQKFEVTYVDIEEVSKSGRMQCLVRKINTKAKQHHAHVQCTLVLHCCFQVQLSTLPVAVCFGDGESHNFPCIVFIIFSTLHLGETVAEAQESAATNALEYLQMMIK